MNINLKFTDWLYDIARAIFVILALPKNEPITPYAKLTIKIALESIAKMEAELGKVKAAFKALSQ